MEQTADAIRALLASRDMDHRAQGLALVESMADPALYGALLAGCRIRWDGWLFSPRGWGDQTRWALLPLLLTAPPDTPWPEGLRPDQIVRLRVDWQLDDAAIEGLIRLPALRELKVSASRTADLTALERMPELRRLDLSGCWNSGTLPKLSAFPGLTRLHVRETLPPEVTACRRLGHLEIVRATGPLDALTRLPRLHTLVLEHPSAETSLAPLAGLLRLRALRIDRLPSRAAPTATAALTELAWRSPAGLEQLTLSGFGVKAPPPGTAMRRLRLDHSPLRTLPASIGRKTALETLSAEDCLLREVDPAIAALQRLRDLNLSNNELTELPLAIGRLSALKRLRAGQNRLRSLPSWLGGLGQLATLRLGGNLLTELPHAIGDLPSLRDLRLGSNRLAELPDSIGRLGALVRLELRSNRLETLPSTIGDLASLRSLDLSQNPLRDLPSELGALRLQSLNLQSALRGRVPAAVFALRGLRQLDLSACRLEAIPQEIAQLEGLRRLDLRGNPLADPSGTRATLAERLPGAEIAISEG